VTRLVHSADWEIPISTSSRIQAFWNWFADWHTDIATAYTNGDSFWLSANLTAQVKRIHPRLNWEMGPYHDPDHTLVISPSDRDHIALARLIVDAAPTLPGWHFLPAKPPKLLKSLTIELPGVRVVADEWRYRLTAYNKMEFFDIEVFTPLLETIVDRELESATRRLIESLVGELIYLERFADVKLIRSLDVASMESLTSFAALARHIAHLL